MLTKFQEARLLFEGCYSLNFFSFIDFVRREIAPYMEMELVIEDYLSEMFNEFTKHQYTAEQIHRGAGKTELGIWITIFYAVAQPINPFSGKKIAEQLVITAADDMLNTLSNRIKHYFYENPRLRLFVPEGINKQGKRNDQWNTKEMYLNNGHMIHFRTILSKSIRGNHVDRVWGDDLVGENSIVVDKDIEERWFAAVHGTTTAKNALVDVTGTPKRLTDLMYKMRETEGYLFIARPIIDKEGKLISHKRWSKEKTDKVKMTIGSVLWQCEYMLDPIDDQTSLIKREWIQQCFSKRLKMQDSLKLIARFERGKDKQINLRPEWTTNIFLGVDFAFSDRITADKSVFSIIAEYKKDKKTYYVVIDEIEKRGMSGLEQMELIKHLHQYYQFDLIGLEENSIKAISANLQRYNLPIRRFWTAATDQKGKIDSTKQYTTVGKRNLILRVGTMFENKELIIPVGDEYSRNLANTMLQELITYAQENGKLVEIGVHGDHPIALAYALETSGRWNTFFCI